MSRGGAWILLAALLALLAPSGAEAATIVNGDFESGNLSGWHVRRAIQAGDWFAYKGTSAPIGGKRKSNPAAPVQAPPQGDYAAITDQANPDTLILYQDIALEAGSDYRLSLLAYYDTYEPIAIPTPDTLSVEEEVLGGKSNQQYRIDLMKPDAPLESIDPADILLTLFRTKPGDPKKLLPTRFTADLSPFAGQTVRLRIANAAHEEVFNAGVDAVSLSRPGSGQPGASSRLGFGKIKANRKNGTAILPVQVPGPGSLTVKGKSVLSPPPRAHASKARKARKAIESVTTKVVGAGTVRIRLKPTLAARAVLKRKHRLRVKVTVTYNPTGGASETASLPVVLRLDPQRQHRR